LQTVYHLATADCWNRQISQNAYSPDAFSNDGFIHCCTREQLAGVASRYYKNTSDLLLLVVDCGRLHAELVYENTVGGDELFPHLYGPLNRDAVVSAHSCAVTISGDLLPAIEQLTAI
jgi:uncharacterized protein (DUF952 family)